MNGKLQLVAAFGLLLAVSLSLGGCAAISGQNPLWLQTKIENAQTKPDHEELAEYYGQEAKTLRAKAEQHEQEALSYGPPPRVYERLYYGRHCNYLAGRYRDGAEENLALAKLHRRMAVDSQ